MVLEKAKPLKWGDPGFPGRPQFSRQAIQNNYFYFLSAALMLLGCCLLMRHKDLTGDPFWPTLKTLIVLQTYEILVIATALIIVRRLRVLDDAFNLLLVEVVLLLDPTFFSNSFFTMNRVESTLVNVVCFALVPVKMAILQKGLRLRLSPRGWAAFLFAAALVYLSEGPLCLGRVLGLFGRSEYFYLIAWMVPVFCALLPPIGDLVTAADSNEAFLPVPRRRFLSRALLWAPLIIIMAHFIETSRVHEIPFYALNLAPLLLGLGVLLIKNRGNTDLLTLLLGVDAVSVPALILSLGPFNMAGFQEKMMPERAVQALPAFVEARVPLMACAAGVVALYVWFYVKFKYRPALVRVAILVAIGGGWLLLKSQLVRHLLRAIWELAGMCLAAVGHFLSSVGGLGLEILRLLGRPLDWLARHPAIFLYTIWAGLLALALRFKNYFTRLAFGLFSVWMVFGWFPQPREDLGFELVECWMILFLVLDHWYPRRDSLAARQTRTTMAVCVVTLGFGRFCYAPSALTAGFGAAEFVLLIFAGLRYRHTSYLVTAAVQAVAFGCVLWHKSGAHLDPAVGVVVGALAVFAVGILVTFNKKRILAWLDRATPGGKPSGLGSTSDSPATGEVPWELFASDRPHELPAPKSPRGSLVPNVPGESRQSLMPEKPHPLVVAGAAPVSAVDDAPIIRLIRALFMSDPARGIFVRHDLDAALLQEIESRIEFEKDELPLVVFFVGQPAPTAWRILLTHRRLICRPFGSARPIAFDYTQIATVRRVFGSITVIGHLGQSTTLPSLSGGSGTMLCQGILTILGTPWDQFAAETASKTAANFRGALLSGFEPKNAPRQEGN